MLTSRTKKRNLFLGILLISMGGFSVVNTLDIHSVAKLYGLLTVCQIGFLLFFLSRISLKPLIK
jgi:amino acid transporter